MSTTQTCSETNKEKTGISCTSCNPLLTHPVEIDERLVQCGACHRTWHREDPKTHNWTFVDHETEKPKLEELRRKFMLCPL